MAASVVQSSTKVNFGGASATLNLSLTGVAAGNSIIVTVSAYNATAAANVTASDGTAYSVVEGTQAGGGAGATATILYRHNVSSGNYTITVTTSAAGGNRYGWARAMEVSGLVNAAPNARMPAANGANGGTSNSPSTGASSATSVANCFVVAALSVSGGGSDAGIDTPATTGYTNHWVDNDFNAEEAGSADYKSVTSTGAQSAAWGTLTGSYLWAASLAAFEETATGSAFNLNDQAPIGMVGALTIQGDIQIVSGNAQFSAPSADVSTGAWGPTSGVSLYAMIDEADPSDADYIRTATPGDVCVVALEAATDPGVSTGHVVSYRIMGDGSSGLQVSLMQGGTPIASWTHDPAPADWTTYVQTLSSGEADAITDYAALRLRFTEV